MDDLEQQIKAWADATAPSTGEAVDARALAAEIVAAEPRGDGGETPRSGRTRRHWVLAVAAALVLVAGIAAVTRRTGDRPAERIQTGTPTTSTSSATTSTTLPTGPVPFELLASSTSTTEDSGALHAAQTAGEAARLWYAAMQAQPPPTFDPAHDLVVSITALGPPCTQLVALERRGTVIEPRFEHSSEGTDCAADLLEHTTYLVRLEWAAIGDRLDLRLPGQASPQPANAEPGYGDQRLQVDRVTHPAVTTAIDLDHTAIPAGDEVAGMVTVVNDSGAPIRTTQCFGADGPWIVEGEIDLVTQPRECAPTTVPEGTSTYPITVRARYWSCLPPGSRPGAGPYCLGDGTPPPLPAGDYELILLRDPNGRIPPPDPVTITVT